MTIFGKKKTEPARDATHGVTRGKEEKKTEEKTSDIKAEKKTEKKAAKKEARTEISKVMEDIILEPWITEKSHAQMAANKYIFRVHPGADKKKIRDAVQAMYNVKVIDVNIINIPPKKRVYGRHTGVKSGYKKAIVTLREGDKIELFKGV